MRPLQTKELLFDFNQRLNKMVVDRARAIVRLEATPINFFIALVIGKVVKTHNAILILCTNGYGEDAAILARSIFETLLNIEYILKENSEERVKRYIEHGRKIKRMYLQALSTHTDAVAYSVSDEERQKIISEDTIVQEKYNFKINGWSDKSGYKMAEDVGMLADYEMIYKMMCGLAHTDILALDGYANVDKEENPKINMDPSDKYVEVTLVFVFEYFLKIVDKWNDLLKLKMDNDLQKFFDEYSSSMREIKSG